MLTSCQHVQLFPQNSIKHSLIFEGPVWFSITATQVELLASHSEMREVLLAWDLSDIGKFAHKDGVLGIEVKGQGAFFFSMMNALTCAHTLQRRLRTDGENAVARRVVQPITRF